MVRMDPTLLDGVVAGNDCGDVAGRNKLRQSLMPLISRHRCFAKSSRDLVLDTRKRAWTYAMLRTTVSLDRLSQSPLLPPVHVTGEEKYFQHANEKGGRLMNENTSQSSPHRALRRHTRSEHIATPPMP